MAKSKVTHLKFGRVKTANGKTRFRRISKTKTVRKGPKESEFLRSIKGLNSADRLKAIKANIRGKTAQVGTTAASTAGGAISVGGSLSQGNVDYSNQANLSQNVQGGISQSAQHREDDDEENDFPGIN